jgi:glycosyltransferase involved in cell wall biosynthesis
MEESSFVVCHAMEWESLVEGGVSVSARQQRKALEAAEVRYTCDPGDDHDLLHLNFPGPASAFRQLRAERRDVPVVFHVHSLGENIAGTYRFSDALAPLLQRYFTSLYDRADRVIAVSEFVRERLAANGVTGEVTVVSNGVDTAALEGHRTVTVSPGYRTEGFTAVNLAQVYEIKGIGDFVRTARRLPAVQFRWFGDRHRVLAPRSTKRTIAEAPENVRFPGFIEDKREAFALGDVFFFPTHRDNQPIAVLEALYCGMPIVTRDIPAFEGWLEDGRNCLKADSVEGFRAAIERLRAEPALRERLSRAAAADAREHSLDAVGRRLRAVYESVLAG